MSHTLFDVYFRGIRKYILVVSTLFMLQNLSGQTQQKSIDIYAYLYDPSLNYYEVCATLDAYFSTHSTGKGSGFKQYQRWKQERRFHIDKNGNAISSAPSIAPNKKERVLQSVGTPNTGFNWIELGPYGIERQSSRVRDLDFSSNGSIIYAVAEGGGIWKTSNEGSSWQVITDELSSTNLYTVAVAPSNDQIIYAGGESYGIFKSTDGGTNWTATTFNNQSSTLVWELKVHPTNPSYVLAATSNGIFITTNGGSSWTQSTFTYSEDITFKPGDVNTVYAVGHGNYYRSTNGGVSFATNTTLLSAYTRSKIAVTAANPAYVYILTANGDAFGALKRSTDSGLNFSDRSVGNPGSGTNYFCPDYNGGCGQAGHNMAIAISPTNSEEIMIGANLCSRSTNGGQTFTLTADHHWDVHSIAYRNNKVYNGNDGGLYVSSNNGTNWQFISYGLKARLCYSVHAAKAEPAVVTFGSQDNNAARKLGTVWQALYGPVEGKDCVFDCKDPDIAYTCDYGYNIAVYDHVPRTGDFQWETKGLPMPNEGKAFYPPLTVDPNVTKVLYLGMQDIYKYVNLEPTPIKISNFGGPESIEFIEVANSNSQYIYTIKGNKIYRTSNGGSSWTLINTTANMPIQLTVHPSNPNKVAIVTNSSSTEKVLYSSNGGTSWSDYTANLSEVARCIAFDSSSSDDLFVGCNRGVFVRNTSTNAWSSINTNLANSPVSDLDIHYKTRKIRASTYGRGIWESAIPTTNVLPTVSITAPANNASLSVGDITITATAADANGTVSKVEFFRNGTKLGEDLTTPYSYLWTGVAAGTYALTAVATDNQGATATSSIVNITVTGGGGNCASLATYGPYPNVYNTGDRVKYNNVIYESQVNGLYNVTPGTAEHWWKTIGPCSSGNVAPTTSITAPANNATFTAPATISIAANATDSDGTISKVEFFQNGIKLGEDLTAPYTYSWTNVAAGNYVLTVKATDNGGASTTSTAVNITSSAPNQLPTATITAPANNATFAAPATVNITATATDADGTVSKVEFYQNGTKVGEDLSSPYAFSWTSVAAGTYALTAKATDNIGASTTSATVNITVTGNQLPTAAITAPANNATFTAPATVNITATATDADGTVSKVEFYQNGTKIGEDLSSPYAFSWTSVAAGTYALTAKSTDNLGATKTSTAVNITVTAANQLPTAAITAPANNATFTAPAAVNITATATDADGTVSKVEFYQNGTKIGEDLSSPYAFSWTNVVAGTYALTAKSTDNLGATKTSTAINIVVNGSGGCTSAQWTVGNGSYVAGTVVKNTVSGVVRKYSCTIAGWCQSTSAFYYEPGNGLAWQDCWTDLGVCNSRTGDVEYTEELFSVYPNPANSSLTINGIAEGYVHISVINSTGVEVLSKEMTTPHDLHAELDVQHLHGGIYTIKITSGERVVLKQFIKN